MVFSPAFGKQHSSTMNPATNMIGPSESADEDLPSVMTCANYLKLPPYSTKVKKLIYGRYVENKNQIPNCMLTHALFKFTFPLSFQDIMYKKLLYAINEGQGSFDLS